MPRRVVYFPPPRAPMATGFALGLCAAAACSRPPPPPVVYVQRPPPPPQVVYIQQRPPPPMVVPVMPCPAPMMYAPQPTYVPVPVPMPSYPPPPPVSYIDYSQTAPLPPAPAPVMPAQLSPGNKVCLQSITCNRELRADPNGYVDFNGSGGPYTHFYVHIEGPYVKFQSAAMPQLWLSVDPVTCMLDCRGQGAQNCLFQPVSQGSNVFAFVSQPYPGYGIGAHPDGRAMNPREANPESPSCKFFVRAPY